MIDESKIEILTLEKAEELKDHAHERYMETSRKLNAYEKKRNVALWCVAGAAVSAFLAAQNQDGDVGAVMFFGAVFFASAGYAFYGLSLWFSDDRKTQQTMAKWAFEQEMHLSGESRKLREPEQESRPERRSRRNHHRHKRHSSHGQQHRRGHRPHR